MLDKIKDRQPPVPAGFRHTGGSWDDGFVIESDGDKSRFIWIPVSALPSDGYLCEGMPGAQFGSRPYGYSGVSGRKMPAALRRQARSVRKYGGFFLAGYSASSDGKGGYCFRAALQPVTMINLYHARRAAEACSFGSVGAHLPFSAEMDSAISWLLLTGRLTQAELKGAVAAALCIPNTAAEETSRRLAAMGIMAIWNFTNADICMNEPEVIVENIHFSDSLLCLGYKLKAEVEQRQTDVSPESPVLARLVGIDA